MNSLAALIVVPVLGLTAALAVAPGCGSGSGGSVSCQNPTSMQQTCITCVNSSCTQNISNVQNDCASILACDEACNCGDTTCTTQCSSGADAGTACIGDVLGLSDCATEMCKSQCTGALF
jgi:hypothetical protein